MNNIKAVILAAGRGIRLQGFAGEKPKSLLPLTSQKHSEIKTSSFLERQIQCLQKSGVEKIAVVVGYNKEHIYEKLDQQPITIIENSYPDLSKSGSLHSFQFAVNSAFNPLDNTSHTLLLDADILYEQRVIDFFLQHLHEKNSLLITPNIHEDTEEVRIYGTEQQPQFIGKGLQPILVNNSKCLGEATGIVHFTPQDHQLIKSQINWLLGDPSAKIDSFEYKGFGPAKIATEHEELSQRLMMLNKMEICLLPKEALFMEVDFKDEYHQAVNFLFPQILDQDDQNKI